MLDVEQNAFTKSPLSLKEKRERRKKRRERKERLLAKRATAATPEPAIETLEDAPPAGHSSKSKLNPRFSARYLLWKLKSFVFFWKRKSEEDEEEHEPNAYVADFRSGLIFEYVDPSLIPDDSRLRTYKKRQLHVLARDKEDILRVVEPPRVIGANESPSEVYTALNCPLVEVVFGIPDTLWNKISHIALYVIMGIDGIVVFLIWGSSL